MSLPLASIRRSPTRRMSHCTSTATTATRSFMHTRETRHWIHAMYRMTLSQPLSHTPHNSSSTTRSFWHSSRSRSPRFLSWSSNDIFKSTVSHSPSASSSSSQATTASRWTSKQSHGNPRLSSTSPYSQVSRERIESIAQYPDQAAKEMLEPNMTLLLRTSEREGATTTASSLTHATTETQQQQLSRQFGSDVADGNSRATQDLLRFDPFSSRPSPRPILAGTSAIRSTTMRSQQSMWTAAVRRARDVHQKAPEYLIQDAHGGLYHNSRQFDPFSRYEGNVFRQCQQQFESHQPPLESLLMDRLNLHSGSSFSTPLASRSQFSGFSPRDFLPLSANTRTGVGLMRSDNASQEHVVLTRSPLVAEDNGLMPTTSTTCFPSASEEAAAAPAIGERPTNWDNNTTRLSTHTNSTSPSTASISFADEYKMFMTTVFKSGHEEGISATALEAELFRFGSAVQERLFDVPSFLQSAWSRQDLVILGLERVVQEAMIASRHPANTTTTTIADRVALAELLVRHDMQDLLSVATLHAWKHQLMQASKKDFRKAGMEKTAWRARLDATLERIRAQQHKSMTKEAWEVRTMPFRTKLAIFRKSGILPTRQEYREFMLLGLRAERYDEVYQAFHHLVENGGTADARLYTMYITALARQGRMDHALEVFRGMERMGVPPSVVTYGVMVDGYGRQQDSQGMLATLQAMQRAGVEPNLPIMSSLLANLIRSREFHKAVKVHDQLVASKIELDDTTKNSLLTLLQHTNGSQAAYAALMERLEAGSSKKPTSSSTSSLSKYAMQEGLSPDTKDDHRPGELAGFNKALDGFADAMDAVRFAAAYKAMQARGLGPNRYTYNTLLKFYKRVGADLKCSLEILKTMNSKYPLQPDVVAYTTVMQHAAAAATASGSRQSGSSETTTMDVAWDLYDEMMQKQVAPDLVCYGTLIDMIGQDPGSARARQLVRRHFMTGSHHRGGGGLPLDISDECDQTTGLGLASTLYVQLLNQGLEPTPQIFGSLMHLVIRRGYYSHEVEAIYGEMIRRGVEPNTTLLTNLIQGFSYVRDFKAGWKVWEFMVAHDVPRNAITYAHLVRLCERSFQPSYLDALQEQRQQSRELKDALTRYRDSVQEFDRFGVRIERFGEEEARYQQLKAKLEELEKSDKALGLSNTADRVVGGSQQQKRREFKPATAMVSGNVDRYGSSPLMSSAQESSNSSDATASINSVKKNTKIRDWVPAELRETIERQMKADGVSWSKVQRFRKSIREMKAWDPIVAKIEQLPSSSFSSSDKPASEDTASAVKAGSHGSSTSTPTPAATSADLIAALSYDPLNDGSNPSKKKALDVAAPGLGHGYLPQRMLPPNVTVTWDSTSQAPVVHELTPNDPAYRPLDSKAVLRQYPSLASHPFEWWKTYRASAEVKSARRASTSEAKAVLGDVQQQEGKKAASERHAKRIQKMEKRRVKALQRPASSSWTDAALQEMDEEEEARAYAIPGRP